MTRDLLLLVLTLFALGWVLLSLLALPVSAKNWREAWLDWRAHVITGTNGRKQRFLWSRVKQNRDRTGMVVATCLLGLLALASFLLRPLDPWQSVIITIAFFVLLTMLTGWQLLICLEVRTAMRLVDQILDQMDPWTGEERRGRRRP